MTKNKPLHIRVVFKKYLKIQKTSNEHSKFSIRLLF